MRMEAIVDIFLTENIDRARFEVKAMGEKFPIADNATAEGRAINRRGEYIFSQQQ